jgi:hypothetical protein
MKILKKYCSKTNETIANINSILGRQIDISRFSILNKLYLEWEFGKIYQVKAEQRTVCCKILTQL